MSIVRCTGCGAAIETDEDPQYLVEVGNMRRLTWEVAMCRHCRDEMDDSRLAWEMADNSQ